MIEEVAPPLIVLQPPSDSVGEEDKVAAWLSGPVDQGSVPASALRLCLPAFSCPVTSSSETLLRILVLLAFSFD